MDDIPDDDVKDIQDLAIQYTKATKDGDTDAGIEKLTGINLKLINQVDDWKSGAKLYATKHTEIEDMVKHVNTKLPIILSQVDKVTKNSDVILQRFVDAGYINNQEKDELSDQLKGAQADLVNMQRTISKLNVAYTFHKLPSLNRLEKEAKAMLELALYYKQLKRRLHTLNEGNYLATLNTIKDSHSIPEILKAISNGNKSYQGNDLLLTSTRGSKPIQVNMSAALRMYDEGMTLVDDKKDEIKKLQAAIEREIKDYYRQEQRKVINQIDDMETNPKAYSCLLRTHLPFYSSNKTMKQIHVYEDFPPLEHGDMDEYIDLLNKSAAKSKKND